METKRNLRLSPFIEPRSDAAGVCIQTAQVGSKLQLRDIDAAR